MGCIVLVCSGIKSYFRSTKIETNTFDIQGNKKPQAVRPRVNLVKQESDSYFSRLSRFCCRSISPMIGKAYVNLVSIWYAISLCSFCVSGARRNCR